MTTALVVPFGADDSELGKARKAIWRQCYWLWADQMAGAGPGARTMIVASDPLFGMVEDGAYSVTAGFDNRYTHKFSVARAINRAVRFAPPEVGRFVCIGADALPDWRVVDWAAEQLETRPWTLLFGHGGTVTWNETGGVDISGQHEHLTPTVGPIAFTREAFMAVRGYDERFEGWAYEDVDFWSRLKTHPVTRQVIESRTSPYPLLQFPHPDTHHDGTEANPNIRLWREKCSRAALEPRPDGARDNDHPAPHLFGGAA